MSEKHVCGNPEVLVSYLYGEGDAEARRAFDRHLASCDACAREVREFRAVRTGLAQWEPPETLLDFRVVRDEPVRRSWRTWLTWPVMPAWAQMGAAALLVGVAVGISGLEVKYDSQGVTVRTGWSQSPSVAPAAAGTLAAQGEATGGTPWRADLVALEQQLRREWSTASAGSGRTQQAASTSPRTDQEVLARVRQLIDESEQRQDRELALRITQVVRDFDTQRRADMVRVTDGIGAIEGRTVSAVAQQRQMLDYLMRVSSQREPR